MAKIGVEVTIEVLDRPVFLRRLTTDRDWDQFVNLTLSSLDANTRSYLLNSKLGTNQVNHKDPQIDALWDQLLQSADARGVEPPEPRGAALHHRQHGADERHDAYRLSRQRGTM